MAATDNALFLYRNLVDSATLTASSALVTQDNLKDYRPTRFWRSSSTADWVLVDNGSSQVMTHAAAVAYNLDQNGTIRVRVSDDPAFAPANVLFDQTLEAWRPVAGLGFDQFGLSLGGYPLLTSINDYRPYCFVSFGGPLTARYVRFDFSDAGLAGGVMEVGRIFAGLGAQFSHNFDFGWEWEWVDPSEQVETEESVFIIRRRKYRVLRLKQSALASGEVYGAMDDLKRVVGTSRDLMVVLFPTGSVPAQYRTTIYGVPKVNGPIGNPAAPVFSTNLEIRELAR